MKLDSRLALGLGLSSSNIQTVSDIAESPRERLRVAKLLRELDAPNSVRIGSVLTKDPDPVVRCEVALTLGAAARPTTGQVHKKFTSDAVRYLIELAADDDWRVRRNVALAALEHGSEKAFPTIEILLHDRVLQVRNAAFRAYLGLRAFHPNAAAKLQDVEIHGLPISGMRKRMMRGSPSSQIMEAEFGSGAAIGGADDATVTITGAEFASTPVIASVVATRPPRRRLHKLADIFSARSVEERATPARTGRVTTSRTKLDAGGLPYVIVGGDASATADNTKNLVQDPDEFTAAVRGDAQVGGDVGGGDPSSMPPAPPPPPPPKGDGEAKYVVMSGGARRYVNSWFAGHPSPLEPLRYGHEYELGIEVGPQLRVGTLTRDVDFKEPQFGDEDTLDVVVAIVTDDFEVIGRPAQRMALPKDITKKSPTATFRVRPVKNNQDVFINVLFYSRNNLFHESLIGARVQVQSVPDKKLPTSYFPAENRLQTSTARGPRDVNLQIVKTEGKYRFVLFHDFGGEDFDIAWCTLPINHEKLVNLIQGMRNDLVSVVKKEGTLSGGGQELIFYAGEPEAAPLAERRLPRLNRIDDHLYSEAMQVLAEAGGNLFLSLFFSGGGKRKEREQAALVGEKLRQLSSGRSLKIQVLSDEFFLPWNLIYDGKYEDGAITPEGFWGFKHVIEEIPSSTREEEEDDRLSAGESPPAPFPVGMNIGRAGIREVLISPQLEKVRGMGPGVRVLERANEQDVLGALQSKQEQGRLEYFYCHAGTKGDPQQSFDQSYIGLTKADAGLRLKDIKLKAVGARFGDRPVVFLNACESAQMDGRFYDGFVPKFLMMGAQAVVGSDCEVPSLFGAHFGSGFLDAFFRAEPVGAALLKQRRFFLDEYQNPLGLIYRVFGDADAHLSAPLA